MTTGRSGIDWQRYFRYAQERELEAPWMQEPRLDVTGTSPAQQWHKKATQFMVRTQKGASKLDVLRKEYEEANRPEELWKRLVDIGRIAISGQLAERAGRKVGELQIKNKIRQDITVLQEEIEKDNFYTLLYNQAPIVIAAGDFRSPSEILTLLQPPPGMSPEELEEVVDIIEDMVDAVTGKPTFPEMAAEAEDLEFPPLVSPVQITQAPLTLNKLTVNAIVRSLSAPKIPDSVMTRDQWDDFRVEAGMVSDKADLASIEYLQSEAERIINAWQERNNQMEAFRAGVAEMPDYKLIDFLKEAVLQPGLAAAELAGIYFQHVSQPLAGLVWGGYIPDIDAAYWRYRAAGDGVWQALGNSWEEWDAPGEGATEWILKYMLMEGLVDPLSYVGWGLATKITKPLGSFGRLVGAGEKGIMQVMDLPFDMLKAIPRTTWSGDVVRALHLPERLIGQAVIPKTTGQWATIASHKAGQYVDLYMTRRFGRAVWQLTMDEWKDGVQKAIKYTLSNPQLDNDATRAGKELLKHVPVTEGEVLAWAERLGTTLTPEQVTKQTVESVDRIFEDFFSKVGGRRKLVTNQEAADHLVITLYGKRTTEKSVIAAKLLKTRSRQIVAEANSFGVAKTTFSSMRRLIKRAYKVFVDTDSSTAALAMKEMGTASTILTQIPLSIQKVWTNAVNKWVVRPLAESYLTFALYGPMNVIEDVIRTTLGGIAPGAKSAGSFTRKWAGTSYDPPLGVVDQAISETGGFLSARVPGESNNWVLRLAALGSKTWSERAFHYLVRAPGQFSMAMRRNFVDGKATQILKDLGGDRLLRLTNAGPDKLMGVTGKKLTNEIQQQATELAMNGLPDGIRSLVNDYTRAKIIRREVDRILTEHPDMARPSREFIMRQQDDNLLFTNVKPVREPTPAQTIPDATNFKIGECYCNSWKWSVDNKTGSIVQGDVFSPKEGGFIRHSWVEVGEDVVDPTTGIRMDRERWYKLSQAKPDIAFTPEQYSVNLAKSGNHGPWSPETIGDDFIGLEDIDRTVIGPVREATIADSIDGSIREADSLMMYDFITSPERASEQFESLSKLLVDTGAANPEELAQLMQSLNLMSSVYGATPKQIMGRAVERSRGLPFGRRKLELDKVMDSLTIYRERAGVSMDRLMEGIKTNMSTVYKDNPQYIAKSEILFNLQTTKRIRAAELGEDINAWRHQFFADADPSDLKSGQFWDDYSNEVLSRHAEANVEMADFDGQIKRAIDDLDIAGGIRPRQRAPIRVTDRELTLTDIGQLIGARGDDISRALLDVLTSQNDRAMFIKYVRAHVGEGVDVGFSEEAIGRAYDQLWRSLGIDAEQASWISAQRLELDAVRRDLHSLYNSKLLPDEEIANIKKYLNDFADGVENEMFEGVVEHGPFTDRTQEALRESLKGLPNTRAFEDAWDAWVSRSERDALGDLVDLATGSPEYLTRIRDVLKTQYGDNIIVYRGGVARKDLVSVSTDANMAKRFAMTRRQKVVQYSVSVDDVLAVGSRGDFELIVRPSSLRPPTGPAKPVIKPEYTNYNELRQQAMDESHQWYYKEFTDYSNANAFDAIMKSIYPFWTYESQRWFWLPRSFVRHPGTFTSFERWQDNSDYGYIHVPGTSADINPFRGTIYGTLATRLSKRDYPEYYDELGAASGVIEFSDFLSRFGFYPGAHIGIPLSVFGGVEMQFGEALPSVFKTPLDAMIAMFPDNESVKWISDRIFGDRFRNYLTILTVTRMGGDGSLIFSKQAEGIALTPEEEQLWGDARREVGWYSAGFEQFGLFRFRTDEQYQMYDEASKVIEEMTGYTSDQQDWLRKHGYRLWDMIGGMSPSEQAVLQELDYYRWVGNVRPLLPGKQQEILNKVEVAWNRVEEYGEVSMGTKLNLQREFLTGQRGPRDYNDQLLATYNAQRKYLLDQMEIQLTAPIPEGLTKAEREVWIETNSMMTLEGRKEYYKTYGVPQPVLHPMRELSNLYFSVKLNEITDPETGEKVLDWDNFWAQRMAIEQAVPDDLKQEWEDFLSKNSTRMEQVRRDAQINYFRTYNKVWEKIHSLYDEGEQRLIDEYLHLERTGQNLDRQAEIKAVQSARTGNMLISGFRREVSEAKNALRYANPHLDAWLFYWGRTSSFTSPTGEETYRMLARETGRRI